MSAVVYINIYVEGAILPITVKRIDRISPSTFRKVKPSKESAICDHRLNCNNIPSLDEFTILAYEHHKYILEVKESLLIKHDWPVLNKNITSAKLFLFDNN